MVFGQGDNDRVFGQGGRDFLFGNAGRDLLNGGALKDRCRGGAGGTGCAGASAEALGARAVARRTRLAAAGDGRERGAAGIHRRQQPRCRRRRPQGDGDCDPDDDGNEADCTLRAALEEADAVDAEGGRHEIGFSESMTIQPVSTALPAVAQRVAINATASPDCEEAPAIAVVLDGQGATPTGLEVGGAKSLVCGLTVQRFSSAGIVVTGPSTLVGESQVGTDVAGTTAMGNLDGVRVSANEVIVESSLISGNCGTGVAVYSSAPKTWSSCGATGSAPTPRAPRRSATRTASRSPPGTGSKSVARSRWARRRPTPATAPAT